MTQDFITNLLQLGVEGVDLVTSVDLLPPTRLARMTNLQRDVLGRLQVRDGMRRYAWVASGGPVHSQARLKTALSGGELTRFFGIGASLYVDSGAGGQLGSVAQGFSGSLLSFVEGHPPLSGDSWMYIGDAAKMVKVRGRDRLVMPLGLSQPAAALVSVIGSDNRTTIDGFQLAGWTNNAGSGGAPSNALDTDTKFGGASVAFTTAAGSASGGFYNYWGKAASLDLSKLTGTIGIVDSSDNDHIHLWLKIDKPGSIDELRVYLVCSNDFDATVLPGTSATKNTNAFFKTFIPSQFTPMVEATLGAVQGTTDAVELSQLQASLTALPDRSGTTAGALNQQLSQQAALANSGMSLGRGQWTEFGAVGRALRRGEFLRIGSDTARGWSTITGMVIYARVNDGSAVKIQLVEMYMRGGYGPDSSDAASVGYDWRYRHFDPRTGARGRLSPVQAAKLDLVRQNARLLPVAYGDAAVRQEFFRRGGTLPSDWYFVGTNTSDGGCGKDRTTDTAAQAAGTATDTDYHQPVTTVDENGEAVYAQPLPVIFGPAPSAGILFGLGDPYRPGEIYWSRTDDYDHWPLANHAEVCSPSEELMAGGVFGGQAFCFSRLRMFNLLVSVVSNGVTPNPSACTKGVAARGGMVVGVDGVYFVATDGVWKTQGGVPQDLTGDRLEPLFNGKRANGYAPVDFGAASVIRLGIFQNELYFLFQDIDGENPCWVYSLHFNHWRHYGFGWPIASFGPEEQDRPQLLLGARDSGRIYVLDGTHDDGLAIDATLRSGALNQGTPRQQKLFGDLELEADLQGVVATVVTYADQESRLISTKVVQPQAGPVVYLIDAFGTTPVLAKDVSIDVSFSALGVQPWIGRGGPSYVPQPESSMGRLTEWDSLGTATNKRLKGVVIEADTFGFNKRLSVVVDGATAASTEISLQTTGRQVKHITFSSQIECRLVRLVPADTETPWLPYSIQWIFDQEPLELVRWETQETDHGVPVEQTLLHGYIKLKSSGVVTLTITAKRADGTTTSGVVSLVSTAGEAVKQYVTLPVLKGLLFKYVFTADAAFRLYREESAVYVQPWGIDQPVPVQPFGTDDLDITRVVRDAAAGAGRAERWFDQSQKLGQD